MYSPSDVFLKPSKNKLSISPSEAPEYLIEIGKPIFNLLMHKF